MTPIGKKASYSLLVEEVAVSDLGLCYPKTRLCLRVGQQLQGRLHGLQVLGRHEDDVLTAVLGDLDPLVGGCNLLGDLGQPSLDLG